MKRWMKSSHIEFIWRDVSKLDKRDRGGLKTSGIKISTKSEKEKVKERRGARRARGQRSHKE